MQAALQAAQSPNVPAQETALVKAVATTVPDEKTVLQATQAHDTNRIRTALAKYDADSAVVDKLDTSQIESEEMTLLQPYIDRYESGVKAAGFKLA